MKRLVLAAPFLATMTCLAGEIETVDSSPVAEGGDYIRRITIDEHHWSYVHVFTNASAVQTFKNTADWSLKVRYLVVGGGGAGGNTVRNSYGGGGGGGGGVAEVENVPFAEGSSWSISVGRGATEQSTQAAGSAISNGVSQICAVPGGGSGGHGTSSSDYAPPIAGAAGGGAAVLGTTTSQGADGTFASFVLNMTPPEDGYSGGKSYSYPGGGGGGAGAAGGDATKGDGLLCAGNGGEGLASDITGASFVYGSGGGGGCINGNSNKGPGGVGGTNAGSGGGRDVATGESLAPTAPVPNSGAGGGGGSGTEYFNGTTGADGIVVIRYDYCDYPCLGGDWVRVIPKSANKTTFIHVFTNVYGVASFSNRSGKDLKMRYLVVGGGGAGGSGSGNYPGGGGGGGGVAEANRVVFAAGSEWAVRVGAGSTAELTQACGSSISNGVREICSVPGGGSGGRVEKNGTYSAALAGAAGGGGVSTSSGVNDGAAGNFPSYVLGMAPPADGYPGGASWSYFSGGGGGAGEAGSSPNKLKQGGKGGEGLASDITGEEFVYGSGGGGGACHGGSNYGPGGNGGTNAGNGGGVVGKSEEESGTNVSATIPVPNSGAGGGGGSAGALSTNESKLPTMGADGIVVIRYDYSPVDLGMTLILR